MSRSAIINFFMFVAFGFPTSSACGGRRIMANGISDYHKSVILDMHNKLRQVVALGQIGNQPPASNMAELTWNDELARRAQYWAETCTSTIHDPGRHLPDYYVGQNIASKWTSESAVTSENVDWLKDAISHWFNEYRSYDFGSEARGTGHYTQLIWAESATIGCGFVSYTDRVNKYHKTYVCNYGPSGNVRGEMPYKKGHPNCKAHKMKPSQNYEGLCDKSLTRRPGYNFLSYKYFYNKLHE